ncbi:MAG: NAD(P)(+) transhydrogenase (Re/Si-specific) subunit beta [Gemmatimonadota bacterium]
MIPPSLERVLYLVSAVLFIAGLQKLQHPDTARRGNQLSAIGMALAIVVTLLAHELVSPLVIVAGLAVGSGAGLWLARSVQMTSMPQMVALLNGLGGGASLLVAGAEYLDAFAAGDPLPETTLVTIVLAVLIGAVTLSGSLIAWGKLQEVLPGRPVTFRGQKLFNTSLGLMVLALGAWIVVSPAEPGWVFHVVWAVSLVLGVTLVLPIGGADMPVVISLLNSYSGIAGAMTGFVIDNEVLIVAGALVGSSGVILTMIMCRAMNRSLANVLFGAFGGGQIQGSKSAAGLTVRSITPGDAAIQLAYAGTVIFVPGYGMAVAQAQHTVRELADQLEKKGVAVKYAIHPVAGRMPGHMNVLLAEANVPYDRLYAMEDVNDEFSSADVVVVIGANDVVNPAARTDPGSPIYGMPILDADRARSCIVLKRSMGAGFAGIENELFYAPRTSMLFGDAKQSLTKLVAEVKQV